LAAAEKDVARGEAYLIADEEYVEIRDLVSAIARELDVDLKVTHLPFWPAYAVAAGVELVCKPFPIEPPIFRRRLDWFRQNRAFDIGKAKRQLGWEPRVDLPTGLHRTADWYAEQEIIQLDG